MNEISPGSYAGRIFSNGGYVMKLSDRLLACADLVIQGNSVVDVGTDHGYLPIYLLKNGIASSVIASDLREKPLQAAKSNAEKYGVHENIDFLLSDGLKNVPVHQIRTIICAGMGGQLIQTILSGARETWNEDYQFILQPQSDIPQFREFLWTNGFRILREKLAMDNRFVYSVMDVRYGGGTPQPLGEYFLPSCLKADPLFNRYSHRVKEGIRQTLRNLEKAKTPQDEKLAYFTLALSEVERMESGA